MSETVLEVDWRPKDNCAACRLGTETIDCAASDVRRLSDEGRYGGRPVRLHRNNVVQGLGPVPCPVMLVGEAPGFQEDRDGYPFNPAAPAGRVLQGALDEVGLYRWTRTIDDAIEEMALSAKAKANVYTGYANFVPYVYETNIVKCRPPNNKIDKFPDAVETCRSLYLLREIAVVQPKVIVCLGKVAASYWFGAQPSLSFREVEVFGGFEPSPVHEIGGAAMVMVMRRTLLIHAPHPSNIARGAKENRPKLVEALRVAKEVGYPVG